MMTLWEADTSYGKILRIDMNIDELTSKLRFYPSDTPVAIGISNGYAILANDILSIHRENKVKAVCLLHIPSGGYFDKNTIKQ